MEAKVDNGGAFGALLTDLSKAFDCLSLELLIAKLDAYGFDKSSLKFIHSYLSNSKQVSSTILYEWLNNNYMKVNTGNCHPEAVAQRCSVKKVFLETPFSL